MKKMIFRLLLPAAIIALLIAPVGGAKDKKVEPVEVQTTEVTPVPQSTPEQPTEQPATQADKNPNAGEEINWQVISGGGNMNGTATIYSLKATVGQTAIGGGSSTSYGLSHGFWQSAGGSGEEYVCGDANGDDQVNVGDAVYLISYIFKQGPAPDPVCIGDANGDGGVNVGDAVYLIAYIFKQGPAPSEDCCS